MSMHTSVYWLLALLLACNSREKVEPLSAKEPAAFQMCQSVELPQGLAVAVRLDTLSAESMVFQLRISNQRGQAQQITFPNASLLSEGGYRHPPLEQEVATATVAAGEEAHFRWKYKPVNDLYLYQRTQLPGPYNERYRLPLSFIEGLRDTLVFCFPHESYLIYSARQASQKPQLYKPAAALQHPERTKQQEAYWQSIADSTGSTHFTEQEFFTGGINIRHALFAYRDTLRLRLQLINHAPYTVEVLSEQISISHKGKQLLPYTAQTKAMSAAALQVVRKGARLPLELLFPLPPAGDSLQLSLQGLQLHPSGRPIFAEDFLFVRE